MKRGRFVEPPPASYREHPHRRGWLGHLRLPASLWLLLHPHANLALWLGLYVEHVAALEALHVSAVHVVIGLHIAVAPGAPFERNHLYHPLR